MSRNINPLLRAYMSGNGIHLCHLLALGPMPDGSFRFLADLTGNLEYDPQDFDATEPFGGDSNGPITWYGRTGVSLSALVSTSDISTDNAEMETLEAVSGFAVEGFTTRQVIDGALDKIPYRCYVVNPKDLSLGHFIWSAGDLGEVRKKGTAIFNFELRSISDRFAQIVGETHSTKCRAIHGSGAIGSGAEVEQLYPCGFDASGTWVSGDVTATHPSDPDLVFYSNDLAGYSANYFAPGLVRVLTGANAGVTREIESFGVDSFGEATVTLSFPFPNAFSVGDDFEIRRSCTKNPFGHNSCYTYFAEQWVLHFRGEPWQPVGDALTLLVPGAGTPGDLGGTGENPVLPPAPQPDPGGGGVNSGGSAVTPRTRGATVVSVLDFGAVGDGVTDDTDAFNDAYDALPGDGGTVLVPGDGRIYIIDPDVMIRPVSFTWLNMDDDATLQASYTAADHKYVIWVNEKENVEISGGRIIGYRDSWAPIAGTTSEWGHGVFFEGSVECTIRDISISKCVGDGVSLGKRNSSITPDDIKIINVNSTQNRRQAFTVGRCTNVVVQDCEGSYTGGTNGTAPKAGIDVEPDLPDSASANGVQIIDCHFHHNTGPGILCYRSADNIQIQGCITEYNSLGVDVYESTGTSIKGSSIRHNRNHGFRAQMSTAAWTVGGAGADKNTFFNNRTDVRGVITSGPTATLTGTSTATADHINISSNSTVTVSTNEVGPT